MTEYPRETSLDSAMNVIYGLLFNKSTHQFCAIKIKELKHSTDSTDR